MFQKVLLVFQIYYFAKDLLYTQQMHFEQYVVLGYFIALINCRVFNNKFTLENPKRGFIMLVILFLIGLIYFLKRFEFLFIKVGQSDFIWKMHGFMFYSIFYLIFIVTLVSITILFFGALVVGGCLLLSARRRDF